jgi:hypothetical protein
MELFMKNPIGIAAESEEERLANIMLSSSMGETFREYQKAVEIARFYNRDSVRPSKPKKPPRPNKGETEGSQITKAAEQYLRKRGKRAKSGEIAKALIAEGVKIGGKDHGSRVSAYLSAAKGTFDNDRKSGGYGLKSLGNGAA